MKAERIIKWISRTKRNIFHKWFAGFESKLFLSLFSAVLLYYDTSCALCSLASVADREITMQKLNVKDFNYLLPLAYQDFAKFQWNDEKINGDVEQKMS